MYVKWERRARHEPHRFGVVNGRYTNLPGSPLLHATLVRSVRVNGKPRQERICYLASIRADRVDNVRAQRTFYEHAWARMVDAGLTQDERAQITDKLAARVPVPSKDDWTEDALGDIAYTEALRDLAVSLFNAFIVCAEASDLVSFLNRTLVLMDRHPDFADRAAKIREAVAQTNATVDDI